MTLAEAVAAFLRDLGACGGLRQFPEAGQWTLDAIKVTQAGDDPKAPVEVFLCLYPGAWVEPCLGCAGPEGTPHVPGCPKVLAEGEGLKAALVGLREFQATRPGELPNPALHAAAVGDAVMAKAEQKFLATLAEIEARDAKPPAQFSPGTWHYEPFPGKAQCEADYLGMRRTNDRNRATCPVCLDLLAMGQGEPEPSPAIQAGEAAAEEVWQQMWASVNEPPPPPAPPADNPLVRYAGRLDADLKREG